MEESTGMSKKIIETVPNKSSCEQPGVQRLATQCAAIKQIPQRIWKYLQVISGYGKDVILISAHKCSEQKMQERKG